MIPPCRIYGATLDDPAPAKGAYSLDSVPRMGVIEAIESLGVETTKRYERWPGGTFCNGFAHDVADRVKAHSGYLEPYIPRLWWRDPESVTEHTKAVYGENCYEMSANSLYRWAATSYARQWWPLFVRTGPMVSVPFITRWARDLAANGYLVLLISHNPNGSGHIAVVRPDGAAPDEINGLHVAQAGLRNFEFGRWSWWTMRNKADGLRMIAVPVAQ